MWAVTFNSQVNWEFITSKVRVLNPSRVGHFGVGDSPYSPDPLARLMSWNVKWSHPTKCSNVLFFGVGPGGYVVYLFPQRLRNTRVKWKKNRNSDRQWGIPNCSAAWKLRAANPLIINRTLRPHVSSVSSVLCIGATFNKLPTKSGNVGLLHCALARGRIWKEWVYIFLISDALSICEQPHSACAHRFRCLYSTRSRVCCLSLSRARYARSSFSSYAGKLNRIRSKTKVESSMWHHLGIAFVLLCGLLTYYGAIFVRFEWVTLPPPPYLHPNPWCYFPLLHST